MVSIQMFGAAIIIILGQVQGHCNVHCAINIYRVNLYNLLLFGNFNCISNIRLFGMYLKLYKKKLAPVNDCRII